MLKTSDMSNATAKTYNRLSSTSSKTLYCTKLFPQIFELQNIKNHAWNEDYKKSHMS